ncbi:MAG: non-canonical purine NTP pyrophosphatase [Candidatus Saccharimonas sp.]
MKEILFATGNKGKVASLERVFGRNGIDLEIRQVDLKLIEPQADTAAEVSRVKARQAYEQLGQSVVVDDGSFHIEALNGFPGPYAKYMNDTIGVDGYLKVMQGINNRRAYFLNSLVFVDEHGVEHVFESSPYTGTIVEEVDDYDDPESWSILFKLFMTDGYDKVIARMTPAERIEADEHLPHDAYTEFAKWLKVYLRETKH